MISAPEGRDEVAEAARVLSALGLVTAYGHVSARAGTAMLITPAADLATVTGSALVEVPLSAAALPPGAPAEAWAHLALYRARSDAGAIARAQPPAAFAAAAVDRGAAPAARPGGVARRVRPGARQRAAAALGRAGRVGGRPPARGRGAAAARERRAHPGRHPRHRGRPHVAAVRGLRHFLAARAGGPVDARCPPQEIASWRAVQDELLPRLWQHLRRRTQERS